MTKVDRHELLGRDFARKDGVARVTGAERYTVDGYSSGVASSNARCTRIPVSEVM
jgi:CO/xanthine dehydrogenase Mo-binding subunit